MARKKPTFDETRLRTSRQLIANSMLTDGAIVSGPYSNDAVAAFRSSAKVYSVLTERGGAEACEYVLHDTAKAIVAAFGPGGWSAALDEIERLRRLLGEAASRIESAADVIEGLDGDIDEECKDERAFAKRIRKEAGIE